MRRNLAPLLGLALLAGGALPATAAQLGLGLHYLHTIKDLSGIDNSSQDDFAPFGSLTWPAGPLRVEADVEWIHDYLGSDGSLFQPSAYGLLSLGTIYGGFGIGTGYLSGDSGGWADNPFYAIRVGTELYLAALTLDVFVSYRFQNASFNDATEDLDLDAIQLAAQVKLGP